ncbi:MAG: hypothetical protein J6C51_05115 [Clostridia bacterium]|nr:hypothetical protein [Clostridia bacterium]
MSREIDLSLNSFLEVMNYDSIESACSISKNGTSYFSKNVLWPCKYHLEILAYTHSWRNYDNIRKLAMAIDHLFTFSEPERTIYSKIKNSYIAPCDAFIKRPVQQYTPICVSGDWIYKMELFARCGVIPYSKYLSNELELLKQSIDINGICNVNVDERYFKNWGAYSGLKIEENWRTEIRKKCDVTFRALLILAYASKDCVYSTNPNLLN